MSVAPEWESRPAESLAPGDRIKWDSGLKEVTANERNPHSESVRRIYYVDHRTRPGRFDLHAATPVSVMPRRD